MSPIKEHLYRALRRSEAFFKTDMVYLARGGFWLTLIQVAAVISSFALSVVFARLFPRDAYGTYKYVAAVAGIIGTFALTGLSTAVTQSVARGYEGALRQGFKENLKWSFGIVLISLSGAAYYLYNGNTVLAVSLLLIATLLPVINGSSLFDPYLSGKKDFKALSFLMIFRNIMPAAILIAALLLSTNLIFIIVVYFLAHAATSYFCYRWALHIHKPKEREDAHMLGYAKHLSFVGILNTIADQLDKIIVYHYVGAVELAVYTFATAVPMQLKAILKGIYPLALPKFAQREREALRSELPGKMLRFLLVIAPIVIIYIIAAPYVYKAFFPKYLDAVRMSQVFALSLLAFVSVIPSTYLQAQKVIGGLYGSNVVFSVVKILFLVAGVSLWGLWGVVIARTTYEFAGLGIVWWFTLRDGTNTTNPAANQEGIS